MHLDPRMSRRTLIRSAVGGTSGLLLSSLVSDRSWADRQKTPLYKISCTEYSLHRMLAKGDLDNLDFASFVRREFSLRAVEYWNAPFRDKAEDERYLAKMRSRAEDAGVEGTVILVDGEGHLGDPDATRRNEAVDRHKKWVTCAARLGCHSIRVNAHSNGSYDMVAAISVLQVEAAEFCSHNKNRIAARRGRKCAGNAQCIESGMATHETDMGS